MNFKYKAVKEGEIVESVRDASDKPSLAAALEREGYMVIAVEAERERKSFDLMRLLSFLNHVGMHDKIIFARNLGAMIEAGLSMTRALSVMERQAKKGKLNRVLRALQQSVSEGKTLSESMEAYPDVFSSLFVSMVRSGEASGNLAGSLKTVAGQMEKSYQLTKKVKGAMIYPAVIICIMIIIGIVMLIYVVPTLTNTFKDLKVELPAVTRLVITLSDFFRENVIVVIVALVATGVGLYYGLRTKLGGRFLDKLVLKLPLFAPMVREINAARTARTLSSLLSSGVDVVIALGVTRDVVQNSYYKEVIGKAEKAIEQGKPISTVFSEREDLYPVFVGEMIAVGEETGNIGNMLLGVANFYEEEVDQKTKNLSTIIEPILMVIIGAGVGFFAIAMLAPTYSLVDAI